MSWDIDTPDLPFKKPEVLEKIEQMGLDQRESLDPQEMEAHIDEAAYSLAKAYKKLEESDYEGCVAVVHSALNEMGGSIDGKMGSLMVGKSEQSAKAACKLAFEEEEFIQ